jgi:hypothetical protein
VTLPLTLPLAPPGVGVVTDDEPLALPPDGGGETGEDPVEPVALLPAPPDGVVLGDAGEPPVLPLLWASVSATGAASTAAPSRAMSKDFIPHLLEAGRGARRMPVMAVETPTGRCR